MRATTDSPVVVSSSMPSVPWTTKARLDPRAWSARPTRRTRLGASTPTTWMRACAGLVSGPQRLKIVRKPRARRKRAEGLHRRVIERRVEEDEAGFAQAFDGEFRREVDGNAEGFEDVGRPAERGDGAIAVLGDLGSGSRGNQGSAAGDVEGERTTAAGADAIDEFGALLVGERNGDGLLAHDVDEAGEFGRLLAARGEDGEQGGSFDVGDLAGEDLAEHVASLLAGELCAVFGERLEKGLQRIHISQYGIALRS